MLLVIRIKIGFYFNVDDDDTLKALYRRMLVGKAKTKSDTILSYQSQTQCTPTTKRHGKLIKYYETRNVLE